MLFLAILINSYAQGQTKTEPTKLSVTEFSEKINTTKTGIVVDVRTPAEFEKGHVKDAININWNGQDFKEQMAKLDKSKPVFVYCLSGGRSAAAAGEMKKMGFGQVFEMSGGMMQWREKNLPETKMASVTKGMSLREYEELLNSDKLVLVDFYADWCVPCREMKPYLEKISVELADQVKLVRINVDENVALCKTLKIVALPVLKLYKKKEVIWENMGLISEKKVRKQLKNN
jgi:thioredoxin 1